MAWSRNKIKFLKKTFVWMFNRHRLYLHIGPSFDGETRLGRTLRHSDWYCLAKDRNLCVCQTGMQRVQNTATVTIHFVCKTFHWEIHDIARHKCQMNQPQGRNTGLACEEHHHFDGSTSMGKWCVCT